MDSYGLIEPIHGDHTLANIRSFIAVAFGINFMIQAVRLGLDSDTKHNDDKLFAVVLILGGPIVLLWLNDQVATLLPSSHKIVGSITAIAIILVGLVGTLLLWKNIGKPKAPKLKGWNIPK